MITPILMAKLLTVPSMLLLLTLLAVLVFSLTYAWMALKTGVVLSLLHCAQSLALEIQDLPPN